MNVDLIKTIVANSPTASTPRAASSVFANGAILAMGKRATAKVEHRICSISISRVFIISLTYE